MWIGIKPRERLKIGGRQEFQRPRLRQIVRSIQDGEQAPGGPIEVLPSQQRKIPLERWSDQDFAEDVVLQMTQDAARVCAPAFLPAPMTIELAGFVHHLASPFQCTRPNLARQSIC